jgi:hypothetical protein
MCRLYEWLSALIPLRRVRARLLGTHIAGCARCRHTLESAEDLEGDTALPDWIAAEKSLWTAVRERIHAAPPEKAPRIFVPYPVDRRRVKAFAAAFAGIALIAAGIILFRPAAGFRDLPRVSIVRAYADGKQAEKYFYQTEGASYVWVAGPEKNNGEKK